MHDWMASRSSGWRGDREEESGAGAWHADNTAENVHRRNVQGNSNMQEVSLVAHKQWSGIQSHTADKTPGAEEDG